MTTLTGLALGGEDEVQGRYVSGGDFSSPRPNAGLVLKRVSGSTARAWRHRSSAPRVSKAISDNCCGTEAATSFFATHVIERPAKVQLSEAMSAALNAKKATMADTVARLSAVALQAEAGDAQRTKLPSCRDVVRTTIMLGNVPLQYDRARLLAVLNCEGFTGLYDFVYLPYRFETALCFGFAFVNLVNADQAELAQQHFRGFTAWGMPCEEPCETSWRDPYQGFAANVERYRNSPVMHPSVADELKPILLADGVRQPYPAPTRKIRAPKITRGASFSFSPEQSTETPLNQLLFNLMSS